MAVLALDQSFNGWSIRSLAGGWFAHICGSNRRSGGLSAKPLTGHFIQRNSFKLELTPEGFGEKPLPLTCSSRFWAPEGPAPNALKEKGNIWGVRALCWANLAGGAVKAQGLNQRERENFSINLNVSFGKIAWVWFSLMRLGFKAFPKKACRLMDVILHLGAHRTASTAFQRYMRRNATALKKTGIGFWGPGRTRQGLLTGVVPVRGAGNASKQLHRATGRIGVNLCHAENAGVSHLVVGDENMIGAPRHNLRSERLYAGIGERMARFDHAFGGRVTRVVLSIRSLESYWTSVAAFAVARGHHVPTEAEFDRLVTANRHWRDVVQDLACAMPDAEILITSYEKFGGRPDALLEQITGGLPTPREHAREWVNRAPSVTKLREILQCRDEDPDRIQADDDYWKPFNKEQAKCLREAYADDLFWLNAGADGLATLIEETRPEQAGEHSQTGQPTRGQIDGIEEDRRLARTGR